MSSSKSSRRKAETVRATFFVWLTVFTLWLIWSGHYSFSHPFLFGMGIACACLVTWLCRRMGLVDGEMLPLHLAFRTLRYIPWLTWQVLISCRDVLRGGLAPKLDLDPQVLTVIADQKTSVGFASYANSITLTPGTLSIELNSAERTIRVHAFSPKTAGDLTNDEMNKRLVEVEGS